MAALRQGLKAESRGPYGQVTVPEVIFDQQRNLRVADLDPAAASGWSVVIAGSDDSAAGLAAATDLAASNRAELVTVRSWALGLPRHDGRQWSAFQPARATS